MPWWWQASTQPFAPPDNWRRWRLICLSLRLNCNTSCYRLLPVNKQKCFGWKIFNEVFEVLTYGFQAKSIDGTLASKYDLQCSVKKLTRYTWTLFTCFCQVYYGFIGFTNQFLIFLLMYEIRGIAKSWSECMSDLDLAFLLISCFKIKIIN